MEFGKTPAEWYSLAPEQRAFLEAAWYEYNRRRQDG